jgi:hypothetical protein
MPSPTAQVSSRPTGGDPYDVDHWYCCDPNVAYCGLDLTGVPEGETAGVMCPLCVLAEETDTIVCGCEAAKP